jgi:hypothetical protein
MAASSKRFVFYRAKRGSDVLENWSVNNPIEPVNTAFVSGAINAGRSSDEVDAIQDGEIALDTQTGKLCLRVLERTIWHRPAVDCPDCDGKLELRKKFFRMGHPASPWFYLCSNHPNNDQGTGQCKTVFPANKSGDLSGDVADAETRRARKLTTEKFQRLWEDAPDVLSAAGDPSELKALVNKAKARAYRFLAKKMEEAGASEGNIQKMDIPTLRIAYKICATSDLEEVMKT